MGQLISEQPALSHAKAANYSGRGVLVRVSPAMRRFRDAQTRLNDFLWSTEICYGHVLASPIDGGEDVWSLFSHAPTQAWFPNKEGERKYRKSAARFLVDVETNAKNLHSVVLADYYGHFELFLEDRLGKYGARAPFLVSMARNKRLAGPYRPIAKQVILADLSRWLRNRIAHPGPAPTEPGDQAFEDLCKSFDPESALDRRAMTESLHHWNLEKADVRACLDEFVRSVAKRCRAANKRGDKLTHAFFHALFTFTHLDGLAFEIEEKLFDPATAEATIRRAPSRIRRHEMMVHALQHSRSAAMTNAAT